ncbi:hypothetical protein GCM10027034_41370 [Ramlibacter solisilvae]|uniref:hypothetical protein n=1 Tax=Ramlibacter tataouinensis TaxID=94132 RepID=UPI0007773622|nr:hypothetical protein [Ramlibacter tataouinensis]
MQAAAGFILMNLVLPLWIAAGLADWHCHRRTGIAVTSGLGENLLHWLMLAEIGAAMAVVACFELNAAVLGVVAGVFLVHEATVYWDLRYSTIRRDVGPWEQMVHSFLELLPLLSLALLALLAWPQALAMVRLGDEMADWVLRPRAQLLPQPYLAVALAAIVVFNVLPLMQETRSCLRARPPRRRKKPVTPAPSPDPAQAPSPPRASRTPAPPGGRPPRVEPQLDPRVEPRLEPRLDPPPPPRPQPTPPPTARTPASPAPK